MNKDKMNNADCPAKIEAIPMLGEGQSARYIDGELVTVHTIGNLIEFKSGIKEQSYWVSGLMDEQGCVINYPCLVLESWLSPFANGEYLCSTGI